MKAPAFDYCKPQSLAQALEVLQTQGDAAQVLAGGQSLLAMMNLRLGAASLLVDITGLDELKTVTEQADHLRIGALVTHSQLLAHPLVAKHVPLLHQAVPNVAHLAIRNRGTLGGSLALADPAAEYPAVALACEAVMVLQGPQGERRVKARDFFQGLYATARQAHELLVAVEWPKLKDGERVGFAQYLVPTGTALTKAIELATRIATNAPLTNFALMHALPRIAEQPADHGFMTEALMSSIAQSAPEAKARVRAFLEGKAPKVSKD